MALAQLERVYALPILTEPFGQASLATFLPWFRRSALTLLALPTALVAMPQQLPTIFSAHGARLVS